MSKPRKGKPDRDIMLAQAEGLFAERGFSACSLRDVLRAMKCSTTAFYARFEGKDEVFEALVEQLLTELRDEAADRLGAAHDVSEGFETGLDVLVEVLTPRRTVVALALSEGAGLAPVRTLLANSFETLAALLQAQLELVDVEDANGRAWSLVGAIHLQIMRWAVFEQVGDAELRDAVDAATRPLMPAG